MMPKTNAYKHTLIHFCPFQVAMSKFDQSTFIDYDKYEFRLKQVREK